MKFIQAVPLMSLALGVANSPYAGEPMGPIQASEVKWGPAPSVLPAGAKISVLSGDPAGTGLVTLRLQMPAGYKIPPHWHPTDEQVTVIKGSLIMGMGDRIDEAQSKTLTAGGFGVAPAKMHHFAWTATGATVQVSLLGPFVITYVTPSDLPSIAK